MSDDEESFTIKNGSSYRCIATSELKIVDILSFLPPNTNYKTFLKCYGTKDDKSYFPYSWFSDSALLDYPKLPDFNDFYSELKQTNVLNEPGELQDHNRKLNSWIIDFAKAYKNNVQSEYDDLFDKLEALKEPNTARENYNQLLDIFESNEMENFADWIRFYNNLDSEPMVEAIEKMLEHYRTENIDLLKSAISIPGIARQVLFNTARKTGACFSLFDQANSDLFRTFNNNLVG